MAGRGLAAAREGRQRTCRLAGIFI